MIKKFGGARLFGEACVFGRIQYIYIDLYNYIISLVPSSYTDSRDTEARSTAPTSKSCSLQSGGSREPSGFTQEIQ